jgi:hypothetical protein
VSKKKLDTDPVILVVDDETDSTDLRGMILGVLLLKAAVRVV